MPINILFCCMGHFCHFIYLFFDKFSSLAKMLLFSVCLARFTTGDLNDCIANRIFTVFEIFWKWKSYMSFISCIVLCNVWLIHYDIQRNNASSQYFFKRKTVTNVYINSSDIFSILLNIATNLVRIVYKSIIIPVLVF